MGNYTDRGRPSIQQLKVLSDFQIAIVFSEQMDESSLESTNAYDIDQNIGNPLISQSLAPLLQEVQLTFDQSLAPATIYTLRIQGLLDCSGNPLDTTLQIGLPGIPEPGDVLINEILFNPLTGGQDYVEITNVSDQIIDLSQLRIGEGFVGNDSIFNDNSISEESRLMLPGDILCLTRDVAIQKQIYFPPPSALFLETDDFPSYDDREGVCVIFDLNGSVLDKFAYLDDFHFPTLVDDDGVSLERISLQVPAAQNDNWHSAAASVNYGTPGYANSQILELSESPSAVRLEPETFSPDDDGVDDVIAIQYNLDFPGGNVRINVLDARGRLVRTLVQNILTSPQEGTFFWDGADDKGTKADIGIYIIQFEVSNAQTGEWQAFRLPCVLAARL
ncbi:MAG: FlgD immunoglobulin-like domain containing protein [Bacteroidota bacterium]